MRLSQLDRINALTAGESINAVKCLSLSEEYLQDHFPRFPVMPGVLMLEAVFQASMFLVRATDRFEYSTVVLQEAKNFKFQGFVQPGDPLEIACELRSNENGIAKVKVKGTVRGESACSGRLVLESYNLAEKEGVDAAIDRYMNREFRLTFRRLCNQLENRDLLALAPLPMELSTAEG